MQLVQLPTLKSASYERLELICERIRAERCSLRVAVERICRQREVAAFVEVELHQVILTLAARQWRGWPFVVSWALSAPDTERAQHHERPCHHHVVFCAGDAHLAECVNQLDRGFLDRRALYLRHRCVLKQAHCQDVVLSSDDPIDLCEHGAESRYVSHIDLQSGAPHRNDDSRSLRHVGGEVEQNLGGLTCSDHRLPHGQDLPQVSRYTLLLECGGSMQEATQHHVGLMQRMHQDLAAHADRVAWRERLRDLFIERSIDLADRFKLRKAVDQSSRRRMLCPATPKLLFDLAATVLASSYTCGTPTGLATDVFGVVIGGPGQDLINSAAVQG